MQNHRDFNRIVDELNRNVAGMVDFVYLPGLRLGATPISSAEFRIEDGAWHAMSAVDRGVFVAPIAAPRERARLEVRVTDQKGASADDIIEGAKTALANRDGQRRWHDRHLARAPSARNAART
jgi:hypothetical protein